MLKKRPEEAVVGDDGADVLVGRGGVDMARGSSHS